MDKQSWPEMKEVLKQVFAQKTRGEWCDILENTDVCFAPVMSLAEAPAHPHNIARRTFVEVDGVVQPAPAPRFSGTPTTIRHGPQAVGSRAAETLSDWGIDAATIEDHLKAAGR